MTRYTKLEGRKPTATRTTESLFDQVHAADSKKRAAEHERDEQGQHSHHDDDGDEDSGPPTTKKSRKRRKLASTAAADSPDAHQDAQETQPDKAPLTKEGKLKRIKLLKLKAKKAKSDDKRRALSRVIRQLEHEVTAEGGILGAYKGKANGGGREWKSGGEERQVETNPWKVMEAERRAKSAARTDARREKRIEERQAGLTCFACRGTGHSARECPNALNAHTSALSEDGGGGGGDVASGAKAKGKDVVGICFRCGSSAHILSRCPVKRKQKKSANAGENGKEDGGEEGEEEDLPFATCFVCSQKGHLASACPQNAERGVFPMGGGACGICKSVRHRARDCPQRLEGETDEEQQRRNRRPMLSALEGGEDDEATAAAAAAAASAGLSRRTSRSASQGKTAAGRAPAAAASAAAAARGLPRKKVVTF